MPGAANEFDQFFTSPPTPTSNGGGEFDQFFTPSARNTSGQVPSQWDAFRYSAADAASFGWGDEGAGVIAGVGAVLDGQDYALAYRQRVDAARRRLDEARALHPVSAMAGTIAGAGATFLVPGGVAATGARLGLGGVAAAGRAGQALTTGRFLPYGATLTREAAGRGFGALAE